MVGKAVNPFIKVRVNLQYHFPFNKQEECKEFSPIYLYRQGKHKFLLTNPLTHLPLLIQLMLLTFKINVSYTLSLSQSIKTFIKVVHFSFSSK